MEHTISELRDVEHGKTAVVICPSPYVKEVDVDGIQAIPDTITIGVNRTGFWRDMHYWFMGIDPMRLSWDMYKPFHLAFRATPSKLCIPKFEARQFERHPLYKISIPNNMAQCEKLAKIRDIYWWIIGGAIHFGAPPKPWKVTNKIEPKYPFDMDLYRNTHFPNGVLFTDKTVTIGALELARFLGCRRVALVGNDLKTGGSSRNSYYIDNRVSHYGWGTQKEEGLYPTDFELAIRSFERCAKIGLFAELPIVDFSLGINDRIKVWPKRKRSELMEWLKEPALLT